jgi:hypothetical protein
LRIGLVISDKFGANLGLSGIVAIVDDILVLGCTQKEHDNNLRAVLERSREKGVKLNEDKLEVGVSELEYFGHIVTSIPLRPSKDSSILR